MNGFDYFQFDWVSLLIRLILSLVVNHSPKLHFLGGGKSAFGVEIILGSTRNLGQYGSSSHDKGTALQSHFKSSDYCTLPAKKQWPAVVCDLHSLLHSQEKDKASPCTVTFIPPSAKYKTLQSTKNPRTGQHSTL